MTAPNEPRPRPPFEQETPSQPFFQTAEFRRAAGLMGLLVLFGLGYFLFMYERASQAEQEAHTRENRNAAQALMPDHVLTQEERDARHTALLSKLEGSLSDTENGQPLLKQTNGYLKLLEVVQRFTPQEVTQRIKLNFEPDLVMKDPDVWRGEFLSARGVLKTLVAVRLERPVLGHADAYRSSCQIEDEQYFFADFLERPVGVVEGDPVDVDGVFYRTVAYEGTTGEHHVAPLFVGRTMRKVPAAVETGWRLWVKEHTLPIVGILALLVFGGSLLFSVIRRSRRHQRPAHATSGSFQELFDKKLRESGKVPPPRE